MEKRIYLSNLCFFIFLSFLQVQGKKRIALVSWHNKEKDRKGMFFIEEGFSVKKNCITHIKELIDFDERKVDLFFSKGLKKGLVIS